MGIFKPQIEKESVESQATPLAGDVLQMLIQQLTGGTAGEGFGPQQRAGGSIQQFIDARADPAKFLELMAPLREAFNLQTDRSAAQTREGFGAQGARLSTSLARTEGRQRGERDIQLDSLISQMFLADQGNLLRAIGAQQEFGTQNLAPFFNLAGQGIFPENTIIQDSQFSQILKPLLQIITAGAAVKGAG